MIILRNKYFTKEGSQEKKTSHKKIAGTLAATAGATTGGLGTYGLSKLVEKNAETNNIRHLISAITSPDADRLDGTFGPIAERHSKRAEFYENLGNSIKKYRTPSVMVGTAVGAYGGYKLYKRLKNKKKKDNNKNEQNS